MDDTPSNELTSEPTSVKWAKELKLPELIVQDLEILEFILEDYNLTRPQVEAAMAAKNISS